METKKKNPKGTVIKKPYKSEELLLTMLDAKKVRKIRGYVKSPVTGELKRILSSVLICAMTYEKGPLASTSTQLPEPETIEDLEKMGYKITVIEDLKRGGCSFIVSWSRQRWYDPILTILNLKK